ncbi:NAD(P)H-dependent oxidoreductase subunit E [Chloroflexota bacterium]
MCPILIKGREDLLLLLVEAQKKHGYLTPRLLTEMAKSLGLSLGDIYGVATFYSFLSVKPQGRNVIRICKSLPCFLKNNHVIIESIEREIGISLYETTSDGRFSLQLTNCIGACDRAPAMMINSDIHTDLTPSKIPKILGLYC